MSERTFQERLRASVVPGHHVVPNGVMLEAADALDERDARIAALEAEIEAVRVALSGYRDSDLASLATTVSARIEALEYEVERQKFRAEEAEAVAADPIACMDNVAEQHAAQIDGMIAARKVAERRLAEAVDLLRDVSLWDHSRVWWDRVDTFLDA